VGKIEGFSEEDKIKVLLWSARHCCVCDKRCGLDIEIAHIDQKRKKGKNEIDNAIPVCYEHHAQIGRYVYDVEHPRGNKYRIKELKKRRDQIYDKYTRHLVPRLNFYLTPRRGDPSHLQFRLPRVGFVMENFGPFLPVRFKINVDVFLGSEKLKPILAPKRPYYTRDGIKWNLNAGLNFFGNFGIPEKCVGSKEGLLIELRVTVIDPYDRPHELLPICQRYVPKGKYWLTDPTSFSELKKFRDNPLTE